MESDPDLLLSNPNGNVEFVTRQQRVLPFLHSRYSLAGLRRIGTQPNNPLHGITLEMILNERVQLVHLSH